MNIKKVIKDIEEELLIKARNLKYSFQAPEKRFLQAGKKAQQGGEREMQELSNLVQTGTTVIDVGANIGGYTYSLCEQVGQEGHVYYVEPIEDLASVVRKAAKQLDLPITVLNCGLSSKSGSAELFIPHEDGRRNTFCASFNKPDKVKEKQTINLRRLDDITKDITRKISFIKIDVEGHEMQVLQGGIETLKKHHPNLLIEIEERHSNIPISETFNFLAELGYKGYYLNPENERVALENFDLQKNQISPQVGTPEYINNFIFYSSPTQSLHIS